MNTAAYLRRLGLSGMLTAPISAESLRALHVAHVEKVAYEALEIWLGRPTTVDPVESAERIIRGRGGYCYHLNGAFSQLATALGYDVTRHRGGVQPRGKEPGVSGNHLVLTVRGLPSDDNPGGEWLADLGLGDALHEPLPLVAGTYRQGPFQYVLRPSEVAPGGWRLDHDPSGSFDGMDFAPAAVGMAAFADKHHELTTSPASGFVRVATVQRRDAYGVDSLRGLALTRLGRGAHSVTLDTARDYYAALADVFLLPLDDVSAGEKDKLWRKVYEAHESWLAGGTA
ncbi:arylamine N-acetyltransferase family protein [Nonomuraea gerenzanensis]|uniref:N-acetyltransferase n=1 Tax=Nonomuraea gerenzanensis TaxID=93944 RepID=A0A1M4E178_9ACTN|nr:arylamine N-acetyltransferase [Nonomuraea gerenzanensis]UBU14843.1 arylamine N-acetyltransferase [Nonomuraea gerenzanensis]SBO92574.1 N-acetyltransferase [Nonomuraea gerenzanensis]